MHPIPQGAGQTFRVIGRLVQGGQAVVFWKMETAGGITLFCEHIQTSAGRIVEVVTYVDVDSLAPRRQMH